MPQGLNKLLEPFLALSLRKRLVVGGVALISLLAFAALITVANRTDYRPLFANLSGEDAGEIVKKLKEQKVPYQITDDGKAVLVPADKVYDLRLSLASDGLPQGGGVGFEIFDRKNFGMTEFVQKLNYQRALQGELSRTISQIAGVESARVHLAIPEKSLFKEAEKPATASVVLKMRGSRRLSEPEVQGVVHLVSSSIEGLEPENVTVLDSRGKMLSANTPTDAASRLSGQRQDLQRQFEKNEEDKLQSLLDKVVGSGRSVARVSASFDLKQVERYEEHYDPDNSAVRSEQRSDEKGASSATPAGIPGAQSNLARNAAPPAASQGGGSKSDETLNYEVSRSTARTTEPAGNLAKVSVAILVDGNYVVPPGAKPDAKPKYQPRSPDELQKIESLVKSAVGYNAERGDQVTVANIPFQETDEGPEPARWYDAPAAQGLMKNGLIGAGFLALLFFVIRPLLKLLKSEKPTEFVPLASDEESAHLLEAQRQEQERLRITQLELAEKVKQDPYQAAQILQNWLAQKN